LLPTPSRHNKSRRLMFHFLDAAKEDQKWGKFCMVKAKFLNENNMQLWRKVDDMKQHIFPFTATKKKSLS
jgi:hypothetical protein